MTVFHDREPTTAAIERPSPSRADPSDVVNYLRTPQALEAYVKGAMLEKDGGYLQAALRHAVQAINRWRIHDVPEWLRPLIRTATAT